MFCLWQLNNISIRFDTVYLLSSHSVIFNNLSFKLVPCSNCVYCTHSAGVLCCVYSVKVFSVVYRSIPVERKLFGEPTQKIPWEWEWEREREEFFSSFFVQQCLWGSFVRSLFCCQKFNKSFIICVETQSAANFCSAYLRQQMLVQHITRYRQLLTTFRTSIDTYRVACWLGLLFSSWNRLISFFLVLRLLFAAILTI